MGLENIPTEYWEYPPPRDADHGILESDKELISWIHHQKEQSSV